MKKTNKKNLSFVTRLAVCFFGAVGILCSALLITGIGQSVKWSSGVVTTASVDVVDETAAAAADGYSEISAGEGRLAFPSVITLTYGQELPVVGYYDDLRGEGFPTDIETTITWPYSLTINGIIPVVAVSGIKQVTFTPNDLGYAAQQIDVNLVVERAELAYPLTTYALTYGTKVPSYIGNFVNAVNPALTTGGTVVWADGVPQYPTVSQSGTMEFTATAQGESAANYKPTTLEINIAVSPFEIYDSLISAVFFKNYSYLTPFSAIKSDMLTELSGKLAKTSVPQIVIDELINNIKATVDSSIVYGAGDYPDVKVGGASYSVGLESVTENVIFTSGVVVPNFSASFVINRRIITEGLIKDVQKQVYDGTSKPTEVVFALDRDMSTEVIFDPGAYDISYYENGALLAQAPVKAGTYQVKLSVDNDNFLMTDVVANYFLDKSTDYDAYLQGLEFNGVQPYGGYVYLRFSYDGNDPVMTLIPANNEIHEFTWSVSVLGGARVFNIGVYTVSFLFKSPNFKYLKETVNGVPVYTDTYEYVVYYSIEAVDGEDVGEGGLAYLFDSLFSDSALSIEYTGEAFDKDDILKLATSYDFEANFIYYTIEVTGSAELKNIDSYNIKVTFVSYNHYSNDTRTEELTLNIVKKGIAIESLDTINLWFDGDPKLPVPTIGNTGVKDVNGQAVSAFVRINRIVGANGVDIPESKWNEVRAVGVYTFYYALVPNEYVTAPEREVTVKINKAPADMLRRLIFDNVKFNNTARFIYDGKTTFVPQITENNLDEKYGIVFVGVTPIGMKEVGDYKATFTFRADSFDLPSGVYEHVLNYDVEGPSNTWTIVAAVGGVAVLLVGAYFGLRYYKKTRPVADGLKPWQKRAPSYDKPQYKPASQGPKPVKEKKVKAPKEKD